jgi:hypothetical protein
MHRLARFPETGGAGIGVVAARLRASEEQETRKESGRE